MPHSSEPTYALVGSAESSFQASTQGRVAEEAAIGLVSEVGSLLEELEGAGVGAHGPAPEADRLVQARLGVGAGLFAALRCKSPPAAAHSLRVAMICSGWAEHLGLSATAREALEIAALLHDVGLIGVPDDVLLKPGPLSVQERLLIDAARSHSLEILRTSCFLPEVLEIVRNVGAWYDGSRAGYDCRGQELPLGARMLTIVEAFDAMTNEQVYRAGMSRERALAELFRCAGTQFDPHLVEQFALFVEAGLSTVRQAVAGRWLERLDPAVANRIWSFWGDWSWGRQPDLLDLFIGRLLENMYDGVIFIDTAMRILLWNHGAERLTGITAESITGRSWSPELLQVRDEKGALIEPDDCPVACTIRSGVQSLRRLTLTGRSGRKVPVDVHIIPVTTDRATEGAIMLLHDASSEISLEQRCQNLHQQATLDPLTQVGNRAEFDRVYEAFIHTHLERQLPCSLIICDLDRFKQINDTYGHQAGDEVIKTLAALLKRAAHPGDLVARYGGEEFVLLCANCDNATAARRAEQIRQAFSQLQFPCLGGASVTASFGVTQVQAGDTPETMLRRADRALLLAKSKGRNRVVQLGAGTDGPEGSRLWNLFQHKPPEADILLQQRLRTPVPLSLAMEKLRGFVADHSGRILSAQTDQIQLEIDTSPSRNRRASDRPMTFLLNIRMKETREAIETDRPSSFSSSQTKIQVALAPKRTRDRRRMDVVARAREVLLSLRAYLMAEDDPQPDTGWEPSLPKKKKRWWAWLWRK
ncbi:MAG: diguanylate cyclase [Thermoguttaceae bacterium]|nr:diguanylate cyclase [Thermoguttaceae bacterium]